MKKKIKNLLLPYRIFILLASVFGVLAHLFFLSFISDLKLLFLTVLWILSIWLYKLESRVSIAASLIFLTVCPFLLILGKETMVEKTTVWFYIFLVIGVSQGVFIKSGKR